MPTTTTKNQPADRQFISAYDDYAVALWRHAYFRVGSREQAEDLVSETFTRAWDHYRGQEVDNLKALLYRILNNLIVDKYRSDRPTVYLDEVAELRAADITPVDPIEVANLRRWLVELPQPYQQVLQWRYIDDLDISEIAVLLSKNQGNVYVIIHRALKALRRLAEVK
jgi:RNA polymerase sigma-70 factor (ECF subfamily)